MTDRPNPSSPAPQPAPPKDKSRFAWRANHRAKAHADAQHEAPEAHYDPGKEHPLIPRGAAALITQQPELNALVERLRKADVVAYDTEFIGELSFHPKLCLIQASSAAEVALVDPLVGLDLTPFWELLADPAVPKVVHAGQQDVEPVVRNLGRGPANVFDTQIAAGLASFPYPVSLSKLVQELTGARLGKGLTFTHWDQRPLSGQQLRYAADDVRYLPLLHALLKAKLEK
ncbi:MAG TPA: ribonuclease D, partial [Humisphaera sp.]